MAADERISTLVKWATSQGASLHPSVEVYDDPITGFSFRVKEGSPTLESWDRIVSLPSTLTLSYLNAVQDESAPFRGAFMAQTPPHVIGRFFLMWQYLLGEASPWWAYIQALPQPDVEEGSWQLAPFWPAEDAELLEGTNVEVGLEKIRRDVRNEYSRAAELFAAGLAEGEGERAGRITTGLYQWAYCVFSSRSFRPSLVIPETEQGRLPQGVKMDDFSVLLPLFDIGNHDMTLDVKWDVIIPPTNGADAATNGTSSSPLSTCELRVGRAFQPGQQVFNNYSMKTNAELLLGYGFMLPPTASLHNDYIHVRKRAASAAASEEYYISLRPLADPSSLLGRHRQSFMIGESESESGDGAVLGAFSHLQTDMVWDIFTTILAGSGARVDDVLPVPEGAEEDGEEAARRQAFFAGRVGEACGGFVEQTAAVIQHKVLQELERLDETEVEVAEEDRERLTANQRLALEYRRRCRAVLESTLEAMEATFSGNE